MKVVIVLLLAAVAFWVWKTGQNVEAPSSPTGVATTTTPGSPAAGPTSLVGRWRSDKGDNYAFREHGKFTASQRSRASQDGIDVDFTANFRGDWKQNGAELELLVERVENVTVISTRPGQGADFATSSAADTVANRVRHSFPASYSSSAAGQRHHFQVEGLAPRAMTLVGGSGRQPFSRVE